MKPASLAAIGTPLTDAYYGPYLSRGHDEDREFARQLESKLAQECEARNALEGDRTELQAKVGQLLEDRRKLMEALHKLMCDTDLLAATAHASHLLSALQERQTEERG